MVWERPRGSGIYPIVKRLLRHIPPEMKTVANIECTRRSAEKAPAGALCHVMTALRGATLLRVYRYRLEGVPKGTRDASSQTKT